MCSWGGSDLGGSRGRRAQQLWGGRGAKRAGALGLAGFGRARGEGKRRRCLYFGSARRKWSRVSHCICGLGKNFARELNVSVPKKTQCKRARELNVSRVCELGGGHFFLATDRSTVHLFLATDISTLNMITYNDRQ